MAGWYIFSDDLDSTIFFAACGSGGTSLIREEGAVSVGFEGAGVV
jgi:hypothetical protein